MTPRRIRETLIYSAVIILALIVVFLLAISPPDFLNNKVVYQGF